MMQPRSQKTRPSSIKVLIADDSWVFRRILRDVFKKMQHIEVLEDAANGVEALEMIIKHRPDVLLLDIEMPTLDGLTTLQHLMIHTPTPTIVFSSLSQEGTARSFDALKYGAVYFIAKSSFFKGSDLAADNELLIKKVQQAAKMKVLSIDPMQPRQTGVPVCMPTQVIFCEDCGARNVIETATCLSGEEIRCQRCGDSLHFSLQERFRRLSYVVMMGAGDGAIVNLLQIIPSLCPEMGGAVVVILHDEVETVASFVDYLAEISAVKVVRGQDGLTMEGGSCYIFSGAEHVTFSPYSGHYVIRVSSDPSTVKQGAINVAMASIAPLLKERVAGVLLSGDDNDGFKGMEAIRVHGGALLSLTASRCLCKEMNEAALRRHPDIPVGDEQGVITLIRSLERQNKQQVVTA